MRINRRTLAACGAAALATGAAVVGATHADAAGPKNIFHMHRSPGIVAAGCLPHAQARVVVQNEGPVEVMKVHATGLPKRTDFDLFVIQVPNAPFGVGWYQGDLETNRKGEARGTFVGRFNQETFAVAPGTAPAPSVHDGPFPDATSNPPFGPDPHLPPGPVVQLADGRRQGRLPDHRDAVQRRAQRGRPGAQHRPVRRREGPARSPQALTRSTRLTLVGVRRHGRQPRPCLHLRQPASWFGPMIRKTTPAGSWSSATRPYGVSSAWEVT